ncbi:transport protein TonB [mine drainage metagenome]|uniref:Transport protein TonB n=1 Tax=mine drainage metagenome TaxID=410659 RepID=A0A1J5S850_9ZZZZ
MRNCGIGSTLWRSLVRSFRRFMKNILRILGSGFLFSAIVGCVSAAAQVQTAQASSTDSGPQVDAAKIAPYQWEQDFICFASAEFHPGDPKPALNPVKVDHMVYDNVVAPGLLTVKPKPVMQPLPKYPDSLRKAGVKGDALVSFVVTSRGTVERAEVLHATDQQFGKAAQAAITRWSYRPGEIRGEPVSCVLVQKIKFEVEAD